MKPFTVEVGEDVLADLTRRLDATRWPDEPPSADPAQGIGVAAVRALVDRWRGGYDWRAAEAELNGFAQFTAGGVHFIAEGDGPPVLLLHGWPSSVWEFHRVIGRLRGDMRLIVPSLPGYGFSFTPGAERHGIVDCADRLHALMTEVLGYERYRVAGGDWGASIAVRLAHAHPEAVAGLHLSMMPLRRPDTWPESEAASREALRRWSREEGGYIQIQGTRPQTLAYGLTDSPVGLLGWIGEKFDRWTDSAGVDPDDLLTTVMIYWVTGAIGSSFWPYYARLHGEWVLDDVVDAGGRIAAPLTYVDFPQEIVHVPRAVVERVFDVERWSTPETGGHFPALEVPDTLADSLREWVSRSRRS
jgi:pimeloyl-ACP methyl ester carboxylesterase